MSHCNKRGNPELEKELAARRTLPYFSSGYLQTHQHHRETWVLWSVTDTFDSCAFPVWMLCVSVSSSTPGPIRKTAIACPSLWTYFGSSQQTSPSWKSVRQRREHQTGYSCPQSKNSMFSYIFKPVSLKVPLSPFLFFSALSSLFHSHAHGRLPTLSMSFPPTACWSFEFKSLLYASVCPHTCIFLLLDLSSAGPSISSASHPQSLQLHLHSPWHTKEVYLRRQPETRAKSWEQIDCLSQSQHRAGAFVLLRPCPIFQ